MVFNEPSSLPYHARALTVAAVVMIRCTSVGGGARAGDFWVAGDDLPEGSAEHWNNRGYELSKKGSHMEAMSCFSISLRKDSRHHVAYYNYARSRALNAVNKFGSTMCYEELKSIANHLEQAVALKPEYRGTIRSDGDLAYIRGSFLYRRLIGFDLADEAELQEILPTVRWGSDDQGLRGSGYILHFGKDNTVKFQYLDYYLNQEQYDLKYIVATGRYQLEDTNIAIALDERAFGSKTGTAVFTSDGLLLNLGSRKNLLFTDEMAWCDH